MNIRRLALRIKMNKIGGSIVHHVALMMKHLRLYGVQVHMVQGYALEDKCGCWHVWAKDEKGIDFDLTSYIFPELNVTLSDTFPDGYERQEFKDEQGKYILDENQRLVELFSKDEKAFWKEAPPKVRNFSVV
jgi:hypothetical protein